MLAVSHLSVTLKLLSWSPFTQNKLEPAKYQVNQEEFIQSIGWYENKRILTRVVEEMVEKGGKEGSNQKTNQQFLNDWTQNKEDERQI